MIAMPFSLYDLTAKQLNLNDLPEFSSVPLCPGFAHQEAAGYADVMETVFRSWSDIPLTENYMETDD